MLVSADIAVLPATVAAHDEENGVMVYKAARTEDIGATWA